MQLESDFHTSVLAKKIIVGTEGPDDLLSIAVDLMNRLTVALHDIGNESGVASNLHATVSFVSKFSQDKPEHHLDSWFLGECVANISTRN